MKRFASTPIEYLIVVTGMSIVLFSYAVSLLSLFTQPVLSVFGTVLGIIWSVYLWNQRQRIAKSLLIAVVVVIGGIAFAQGFFSFPTTTDAHNYHIPRALYWLEHKSILQPEIYTSNDFMGPYPSVVLALLYSLTASDRLLFLSQWTSYLLIIIISGKVLTALGASHKQREFGQILVATIPITVLQASSVQSDLVVALWCLVSILYVLRLNSEKNPMYSIPFAAALGLGILSKATMFLYAVIPLSLFLFFCIQFQNKKKILVPSAIAFGVFVVLTFPHMYQNYRFFGTPLGRFESHKRTIHFTVRGLSVPGIAVNIYRNYLMHFPFGPLGAGADRTVDAFFAVIGTSLSDSSTTWTGARFTHTRYPIPQEDIAIAPLHIVFGSMTFLFILRKKIKTPDAVLLTASWASWIIFSVVLLWQPYHSRQHQAMLLSIIIASVAVIKIPRRAQRVVQLMTVLIAFVVICANTSRPLISYSFAPDAIQDFMPDGFIPPASILNGRDESQLFLSRSYWRPAYTQMADYLKAKNISSVRLDFEEGYEYPFIYLANTRGIEVKAGKSATVDAVIRARASIDQTYEQDTTCFFTPKQDKSICMKIAAQERYFSAL